MNPTTTIIFSDIKHKELGVVEFDGTTLVASNEFAEHMVDHYISRGVSPAEWVAKFSAWSNGYIFSEVSA